MKPFYMLHWASALLVKEEMQYNENESRCCRGHAAKSTPCSKLPHLLLLSNIFIRIECNVFVSKGSRTRVQVHVPTSLNQARRGADFLAPRVIVEHPPRLLLSCHPCLPYPLGVDVLNGIRIRIGVFIWIFSSKMAGGARKWSGEEPTADDGIDVLGSDWELETGNEELFQTRPRQRGGLFARLRSLISSTASRSSMNPPILSTTAEGAHSDDISPSTAKWQRVSKSRSKFWVRWLLWRLPITILCCLGFLHITLATLAQKSAFWDQPTYSPDWGKPGHPGEGLAEYPTDATRDVLPIPCHSHNDYWRRIPLFDAIHWGCTGVEADVWQMNGEEELLVGHSKSSLTKKRTFRSLYVNPLVELLDSMNPTTDFADTSGHGVFDEVPEQTLVLLIDFKTDGEELFPIVQKQLQPLRQKDYLSHWDGQTFISRAVTVVGTGNAPFDMLIANTTYRDIFFDAPIDLFYDGAASSTLIPRGQGGTGTAHTTPDSFNASNSYYASVSFDSSIGLPYGDLSFRQLEMLRGQIKGAHDRGLKARYWETPAWPTSLRNHVWQVLMDEGADMLNVDDLEAAAKFDWKQHIPHRWIDA